VNHFDTQLFYYTTTRKTEYIRIKDSTIVKKINLEQWANLRVLSLINSSMPCPITNPRVYIDGKCTKDRPVTTGVRKDSPATTDKKQSRPVTTGVSQASPVTTDEDRAVQQQRV